MISSLPYVVAHLFWLSIFSLWDYIIIYPFTPLPMTFRFFPCFCCCKHSRTCGRVSLGQAWNCCHNFRQCLSVFQGSYTYPHSLTVGPWDGFNDFSVKIQHVQNRHLVLWLESFVTERLFPFLQLLFSSDVSIATLDFFSLVLLPDESSSILLLSICIRPHAFIF